MSGTSCDVDCIDHAAASKARAAADQFADSAALPLLRALADPVRMRLLVAAVDEPGLCACDLAWIVDRQKSLVSHHLKQLRDTGLLEAQRDGRLMRFQATAIAVALVTSVITAVETREAA